jgi:hypothetical protein
VESERHNEIEDKESLTEQLVLDNEIPQYIENSKIKVLTTRKIRRGVMVILLMDTMTKKFFEQRNRKIKWNHGQYLLKDYVYIKYCYKCQGYGHFQNESRNDTACKKCAEKHYVWACQNKLHCCINCKNSNANFGTSYNIWHSAQHRGLCPSFGAVYNLECNRQL